MKGVTDKVFVVAGASSLFNLTDTGLRNGSITLDSINNTFDNTVDSFMFSFGDKLSSKNKDKKKDWNKYLKSQLKAVDEYRSKPYMDGRYLYVDSGGFQIQMNYLKTEEITPFMECFDKFIREANEKVQYAFSLEIAPSAHFTSEYNTLMDYNVDSYNRHAALPDEIRKKILNIYHFRTPRILDIWRKLLIESNLYKKFSVWSIGGLSANGQRTMMGVPQIYSLAVADIVKYEMDRGNSEGYIHILGSSSEYDLLLVALMRHLYKIFHNFDLKITFDSSKAAQQICLGRYQDIIVNGNIYRLYLRSKEMNTRQMTINGKGYNSLDLYNEYVVNPLNQYGNNFQYMDDFYYIDESGKGTKNEFTNQSINFGEDILEVNDTHTSRIKHEVSLSNMLYIFHYLQTLYNGIEDKVKNSITSTNINEEHVEQLLTDIIMSFRKGKLTRDSRLRIISISRIVEVVRRLDPEWNKLLIEKYMSSQEIVTMSSDKVLSMEF